MSSETLDRRLSVVANQSTDVKRFTVTRGESSCRIQVQGEIQSKGISYQYRNEQMSQNAVPQGRSSSRRGYKVVKVVGMGVSGDSQEQERRDEDSDKAE